MKKTYQFLVVLAAMLFGAMNVSAGERIPLTADMVHTYTGFGLDATRGGVMEDAVCLIGEPAITVFGDENCNAAIDLSPYSKLYINAKAEEAGQNPRIFINRTADNGVYNSDKSQSKCLFVPCTGWGEEFYTVDEDGTYIIDVKKIIREWGYARLHSIKGPTYNTNAILYSIEAEKADADQQVGWVSIINNGDFATDDLESFPVSKNGPNNGDTANDRPTIMTDDDGLKYIVVASDDNATETWSTQFFIKFNEALPEGAKWRLSFDVKADRVQKVTTSSQGEPRKYNMGGIVDEFNATVDWTPISAEGTVTSQVIGENGFKSIAFDLNQDLTTSNNFYFRNIKMEQLKSGASAKFGGIAIQMDFGFDINVAELVAAAKAKRLVFPNDCATVKVNGEAKDVLSVEGFADGRFIIFLAEMFEPTDQVEVTFKNPAGDLQLKYTNGPTPGEAVADGVATAIYDADMSTAADLYPYIMENPVIKDATPQQGSFRVDANLKEFKVTFDKKADVSQAVATLDDQALTVTAVNPDESGFSEEITMTYAGAAMANGMHTIHLSKVYPEYPIDEEVFTDTTYTFSVGPVDVSDLPVDIVPVTYFNSCAAGGIPEGYSIKYQTEAEPRMAPNTYTSGARMFDFAAGGDFTKGLYYREGYVQFGSVEGYSLTLEAGKKYNVHFNTARWKSNGDKTRFQILNENEEPLFTKIIDNQPDVNGNQGAVSGSVVCDFEFAPEATGNYLLRWASTGSETGDPEYKENLLANVKVTYIPSTYGAIEMYNLEAALATAKEKQATYGDERYAGAAQTALSEKIADVDAKKDSYTSPSECNDAIEALTKLCTDLSDHATLCKNYDDIISKGADVVDQNKDKKFANLQQYADLKDVVDKYHGTSTMTNTGTEEEPVWQRIRTFDKLTDDAQLEAAIQELNDIVNLTSLSFTEGVSATGDSGVKVLVDRLRRGAETMQKLDAENPIIEEALNAFEDDDELAEKVKNNIKAALYKKIAEGDATLFPEDESTGLKDSYDMSVFFKNPNVYALQVKDGFTAENVPGWDAVGASGEVITMWVGGTPRNIPGIAEDVVMTKNHTDMRYEQTVTDLPAGIYTVILDATCWEWNSDGTLPDCTNSFAFAKNSEALLAGGEGEDEQFSGKVVLENYGQYSGHHECEMPNIVVTDGYLNVGANFGPNSQFMFDKIVAINLTAPANDIDYSALYDDVASGVEKVANTAKVRAIELYDLNGQRIPVAKKGIVIVKKHMSDGTVKTEKVVK